MTNPDRPTQLLCFPAYKKDSKISENIMEVSIFAVSKHFPHFLCVETMTRKWFIMTNKSVWGISELIISIFFNHDEDKGT